MRNTIIILLISLMAVSCGKDKYTTNPQISYKSVDPNSIRSDLPFQTIPKLTIKVTDSEGDLGIIPSKDTAFVYIKTIVNGVINNKLDSFPMPDIKSYTTKNFQGEILIEPPFPRSNRPSPKTDTLYYEIFVKDFAKNKSNVITTKDPVLYYIR